MIVKVSGSRLEVLEPDDLKALSVRVHGDVDVASAITPLGRVDTDGAHVWLVASALHDAARRSVAPAEQESWSVAFEAMVAYARSKGWTSPDGSALRAHIERV